MEKRFAFDEDLRLRYTAFMQELVQLGHMEPAYGAPSACYYMPYHSVLKETSSTTKLRVVLNASMKSSNGRSLNDTLLCGPRLQDDLFAILLRFRYHRFVMTADVEKMYRQVIVNEEHVNYQRIIWRDSPLKPLQEYRMLRFTYGVASASHLAVKSMQRTARVAAETHKQTAEVILRDFYMDDLLTGAASSAMLARLQKDISFVLSCGGFELRKWASNDKQLFENVPNASNRVSHLLAADEVVRTLGLIWNTEGDFLTFAVQFKPPPLVISKREFLSDASLLFDPLGLLAPCTILPKIWFQQLWRENIGWDEAVPSNIAHSWSIHCNDLLQLASLNVNRWIGTGGEASVTELHVFAKAKVAPLKTPTLPQLELCAAHLAAKLAEQVSTSLGKASIKFFAWTDSTVTLAWLQDHPSRWSTFVDNRVAAVQETLPPECWSHVRSECNPADCASRGVSATFHLQNQLWWNGPLFLREVATTWEHNTNILMSTKLEQRTSKLLSCVSN